MILIANEPIEIEKIISEYPYYGIETDIISKMDNSEIIYKYDSIDLLKFELKMRKEIVKAAKELSRSRISFEVFRKTECNTDYWTRTDEGGFILKDNVKPSDAINDIFINGSKYKTECATAMIIVYYKALLETFSEPLFNKIFKEIHLMNWHYLDRHLREVGLMRKTEDHFPGDRRYFMNPDVNPETAYFRGENVIDLDNGLYYGHGIGIANEKTIIKELNNYRKEGAEKSAYLMDSVGRPNFKKLAYIYYDNKNFNV